MVGRLDDSVGKYLLDFVIKPINYETIEP
jgi:hypothetical protein